MDAQVAKPRRPITIAILALGGEGGGVLADWIVDLAQHGGYLAQATSVPGVAQRTGATIYYVELFPKLAAQAAGREPVLALMPMPGDVDVVLASELMEAARAVERGFVTPDRTTLIASTHRVFAMTEKIALADGRVDAAALLAGCREAARQLVAFDMAALAEATGSVLSAVLFGALAGSGALPFPRTAFEAAIRRGGVGVTGSLAAFGAGFEAARAGDAAIAAPAPADESDARPVRQALASKPDADFPAKRSPWSSPPSSGWSTTRTWTTPRIIWRGSSASRTSSGSTATAPAGCSRKPRASSRSAWPTRTRSASPTSRSASSRFARVREEVQVEDGQILEIAEFFHPRTQEIADTLPAGLGRWLIAHRLGARLARSPHPQGKGRQDHVGQRLRAALSAVEAQAVAPPLAALRRRAGGADGLARPRRRDRTRRLPAGPAGRAHAQPGEGLRRHPRTRAGQVRQALLLCFPACAGEAIPGALLESLIKAALADEGGQALDKAIADLMPATVSSPMTGATRQAS